VRENASAAARSAEKEAKIARDGAALFAQGMEKISPLDKLLAQKMLERNADRPGPKLALGKTKGMERD
jgi:hypothetical protein